MALQGGTDAIGLKYAIGAALVAGGGWAVAVRAGVDPPGAAMALGAAWGVQVVTFGPLPGALRAGRDATTLWIGGIAVRGLVFVAAWLLVRAEVVAPETAVAFGLGLVALLILEAAWLTRISAAAGSEDT